MQAASAPAYHYAYYGRLAVNVILLLTYRTVLHMFCVVGLVLWSYVLLIIVPLCATSLTPPPPPPIILCCSSCTVRRSRWNAFLLAFKMLGTCIYHTFPILRILVNIYCLFSLHPNLEDGCMPSIPPTLQYCLQKCNDNRLSSY